METEENIHFTDKVVDALKKAAIELEELQLQVALGKAEARDKYEEIKKKMNLFIHDSKSKINAGKKKFDDIHTKFDELRVQLSLGKAETIDAFKEQKKKLLLAIHDIEVKIKSNDTYKRIYAFVLIEIEKFKVQLAALEHKFEKGKESAKASFEKGKAEFNEFVDKLKERFTKTEETNWDHIQGEVSQAFVHFNQAFKMP
jgi:hypothetical protein